MKILYVITGRYPTERAYGIQIEKTTEALRALGVEVTLVAPSPRWQWLLRFGPAGFYLRTFIFKNRMWFSGRLRGYDAFYTRDPYAAFELSFVSKNIFIELHDLKTHWLIRLALMRVKGIVAISKGLAEKAKTISHSPIVIAPDGVDLEKFDVNISQSAARREFNLPLDKKIVLYAGLFDEWKGYRTLLEASRHFGPYTLLVMAGGRPDQIIALSREFPNVQFLGWTPYEKLPSLQKAADVLVLPNSAKFVISREYTSPLKLFAYMASGVPIVASDLPSIREVIDETMATFVPPDDPRALAEVTSEVLDLPAGKAGNIRIFADKALRAKEAVKKYSWQKRAQTILNFLTQNTP